MYITEKRGNGYDGCSMSNNARAAYASGSQPIYRDIITNNKGLFGLQDFVRSIYPDCWHAELILK